MGQIRILEFVNMITDPAPDTDPGLFVSVFKDATKNCVFFSVFSLITFFNTVRYSTLLHLPPLRWRLRHWLSDALTTLLDVFLLLLFVSIFTSV